MHSTPREPPIHEGQIPSGVNERLEFEHSGELEDLLETVEERRELTQPDTAGAIFVRGVALLCACSLSVGSH